MPTEQHRPGCSRHCLLCAVHKFETRHAGHRATAEHSVHREQCRVQARLKVLARSVRKRARVQRRQAGGCANMQDKGMRPRSCCTLQHRRYQALKSMLRRAKTHACS